MAFAGLLLETFWETASTNAQQVKNAATTGVCALRRPSKAGPGDQQDAWSLPSTTLPIQGDSAKVCHPASSPLPKAAGDLGGAAGDNTITTTTTTTTTATPEQQQLTKGTMERYMGTSGAFPPILKWRAEELVVVLRNFYPLLQTLWRVMLDGAQLVGCLSLHMVSLFVPPVLRLVPDTYPWKYTDWKLWLLKEVPDFYVGKIAWITGASTGIGEGLAIALAARGVGGLIITSRNVSDLEKLKQKILANQKAQQQQQLSGGLSEADILVLPADLVQLELGRQLVDQAVQFKGKVHLLFNNAGVLNQDCLPNWCVTKDLLDLNLLACMKLTHEILPHMLAQKAEVCNVVFSNSFHSSVVLPRRGIYAASKFGITAFCQSLNSELRSGRAGEADDTEVSKPSTVVPEQPKTTDEDDVASQGEAGLTMKGLVVRRCLTIPLSLVWQLGCKVVLSGWHEPSDRAPAPGVYVTNVLFGHVKSELTRKRISKAFERKVGVQHHPSSVEKEAVTPDMGDMHLKETGLHEWKAAERVLTAVSKCKSEAVVGLPHDMIAWKAQRFMPFFAAKLIYALEKFVCYMLEDVEKKAVSNAMRKQREKIGCVTCLMGEPIGAMMSVREEEAEMGAGQCEEKVRTNLERRKETTEEEWSSAIDN